MSVYALVKHLVSMGTRCKSCSSTGNRYENVQQGSGIYCRWHVQHRTCGSCNGWGFHGRKVQKILTFMATKGHKLEPDLNAVRTYMSAAEFAEIRAHNYAAEMSDTSEQVAANYAAELSRMDALL